MLYNSLKILHILSAALLLSVMGHSYFLWKNNKKSPEVITTIQTQTWLMILPLTVFQLFTGFTIISLKHYDTNQLWIKGSVIGFITLMVAWFGFIYFLGKRQLPSLLFYLCSLTLLCMIFFMTSKI
jgi:uncharacterized membrane protein